MIDFASALEEIVGNSILFTAVAKPKIDFVREIITDWAKETDAEVSSIESLINLSKTKVESLENLDILSIEKIRQIELCTRGQCCNEQWYLCRKGVITASKAIEVITKMKKVRKGGGGVVNIWSLKEKNSRMTFVNPNIQTLKYGRDMEIEAVSTFAEYIKNYQQDCSISECGLVLNETVPYIGKNPDRLMSCSFCGKAYTEIKYSYSINYTEPNEQNLDYLHKDGDTVKLN